MKRKAIIIGAAVILLLGASGFGLAALSSAGSDAKPATMTTTVATGSVVSSVAGKGAISAAATANVSFAVPGTVTGIAVAVGQTVAAGQEVATIDPAAADRELEKARSALAAAETVLGNSRASYARAQAGVAAARAALAAPAPAAGSAPSRDAPEDAAVAAQAAAAQAASAQAAAAQAVRDAETALATADTEVVGSVKARDDAGRDVATAEAARAATSLKAPIAGVVTAVNGTIGSVAGGTGTSQEQTSGTTQSTAATALVQISDVSKLRVTAAIPEADIGAVQAGQAASITLAGGSATTLTGTVVTVAPTPQSSAEGVVSYPVTVELSDAAPSVKLGQTGFVTITTVERPDVLTLSTDAIVLTSPGVGTVTRVDKKGVVAQAEVGLGISGNGVTEITSGLVEGDVVQLPLPAAAPDAGTPGMPGGVGDEGGGGGFGAGGGFGDGGVAP